MHHRHDEHSKSPFTSIMTGIMFACAFGAAWFFTKSWFFIFPLVFVGLMPIINGLSRLSGRKKYKEISRKSSKLSVEKQILLVAKQEKGKVTPALIALNSDLPLEEVEQALSEMVKKGFVEMNVTSQGRVEYIFPDFSDHDKAITEF
jgi:hypothetical protein